MCFYLGYILYNCYYQMWLHLHMYNYEHIMFKIMYINEHNIAIFIQ